MEYRKLIAFGKNSYVVSLPKQWIKQNKLEKGNLVHIEESGPNLILSRKGNIAEKVEKEKVILVDKKPLKRVQREVNSAYVLNCRKITIKGEEVKTNIKNLQTVFNNLIALEVMDQTPDSLIAKDFLSMDKVSVKETLQKMDVVIRAMFKEVQESFNPEIHDNITERDHYVDRLYLLLYRGVLFNLDNPLSSLKNLQMNSIELHNYLLAGFYVEGISEEIKRICQIATQLSCTENLKKEIIQLIQKLQGYYLDTIKAFHSKDTEIALQLSDRKAEFNGILDVLLQKNKKIDEYNSMISRMRRLISLNHNLGRLTYQDCHYFSDLSKP